MYITTQLSNMNVYSQLKQIRKEQGFTLKQIADKIGCSKQYVHQIESGNASIDKLNELAGLYGYQVEVILKRI